MMKVHYLPSVISTSRMSTLFDVLDNLFQELIQYIRTEPQFKEYIKTYYIKEATDLEIDTVLKLYPQDITQGSPYDTGFLNALTPQNKRVASFLGDLVFQAPRKYFLESIANEQPVWSYLSKRFKYLPVVGSVSSDSLPSSINHVDDMDYDIDLGTYNRPV
jgi:acetylcholinesterase